MVVCLVACLFACLLVCLFVCLFVHLFVYLFFFYFGCVLLALACVGASCATCRPLNAVLAKGAMQCLLFVKPPAARSLCASSGPKICAASMVVETAAKPPGKAVKPGGPRPLNSLYPISSRSAALTTGGEWYAEVNMKP